MKESRLRWELGIIYERLDDMIPGYEENKPIRQEHITGLRFDKVELEVRIILNTYSFDITYSKNKYVISWCRKEETGINTCKYIRDGFSECDDLSEVIRTIDHYLYAGFSPERGVWWQLNKRPVGFVKKRVWGP